MVVNHFERNDTGRGDWTMEDSFTYICEELDTADMTQDQYFLLLTECKDYYGQFVELDS
jgi:hypothetical protein